MLFKARAESFQPKRDYKVIIAWWDRGGLTSNNKMHELAFEGLKSNLTEPYTPQDGDVAETSNRIIINDWNTMTKRVNCPKWFWVPEMKTAVYIHVKSNKNSNVIYWSRSEVIRVVVCLEGKYFGLTGVGLYYLRYGTKKKTSKVC